MRAEKFSLVLIGICFLMGYTNGVSKFVERYNWKKLDFVFPNRALKQRSLANGDYIPENTFPIGIEHWENKIFVSVPRWRVGVPATLTYIDTTKTPTGSPELIPYPDFASNKMGDCLNGLTTVYRVKADKCGRLWVFDAGTLDVLNNTQFLCPYALNVFDLSTNTRIRRYEFRPEDTNAQTFIANIAVDIGKSCDDTFVYLTDDIGFGLIVYSWQQNKSWRFEHNYFYPDPLKGVAGLNFQWPAGIFGMALSAIQNDGYRTFYFSSLTGHREFYVSTKILRDSRRVDDSFHEFFYLEERGPNSHTTSQVMNDDGLMLFNLIDQNAVGCWHSSFPYTPRFHGIVDRDDVGLVFPCDLKIDENSDVWVLSNSLPIFIMSQYDFNEINFRIYSAPLDKLVAGTVCDVRERYKVIDTGQKTSAINNYLPYQSPQPLPSSFVHTTQRIPTAKAFIYNQHNGVSLETVSPYSFGGARYQSTITYPGSNSYRKNNPWWAHSSW